MYQSFYEQNMLNSLAVRYCGFEEAATNTISTHLYQVVPSQMASCMRNTIFTVCKNYQKLHNILQQANTIKKWKFYHIIICSIPDKFSQITRRQLMQEIVRLNSIWQVAQFKTFIVPIEMGDLQLQQILNYCEIGGPNWMSFPTTMRNFNETLKEIIKEIGLHQKRTVFISDQQRFEVKMNSQQATSLAITFSIESTEIMKGQKWDSAVNLISFYLRNLGQKDLVSGVIFSSQPWVIANITANIPQPMHKLQPQPQPMQNQIQYQNNQPNYAVAVNRPNNNNNAGLFVFFCFCLLTLVIIIVLAAR